MTRRSCPQFVTLSLSLLLFVSLTEGLSLSHARRAQRREREPERERGAVLCVKHTHLISTFVRFFP